jgi:diguanylate cyclase (GGDEF)-like protein
VEPLGLTEQYREAQIILCEGGTLHSWKEWLGIEYWSETTLKAFLLPNGLILLATALLLYSGLIPSPDSAVRFFYTAAFGAGLVLAWRFHSSRVLFALVTLVLADRALAFFTAGHLPASPISRSAFEAVAVLVPLNFIVLSFVKERGFTIPDVGLRLLLLFLESVLVTLSCRPDHAGGVHWLNVALLNRSWFAWARVPQIAWLVIVAALIAMALRFLRFRKPVESGFFWSLIAVLLYLQKGGIGLAPTAYLASAALVLLASVVETSYLMAYHDELTGLPARRAFNDAIAGLEERYAIAIVDVDHFKKFNDTYGHETGDQVLRMVASRLAKVSGGGKSFRCGGEEFSILFPGKSSKDALEHLEILRQEIEESTFQVRTQSERRRSPRGSDRRTAPKSSPRKRSRGSTEARAVSVTVSMGVAEPSTRNHNVDQVIRAADKALYRAKEAGRNRVEMDNPARTRAIAAKRSPA